MTSYFNPLMLKFSSRLTSAVLVLNYTIEHTYQLGVQLSMLPHTLFKVKLADNCFTCRIARQGQRLAAGIHQ